LLAARRLPAFDGKRSCLILGGLQLRDLAVALVRSLLLAEINGGRSRTLLVLTSSPSTTPWMSSMASTMGTDGKLETDRYGVPQFAGEVELLEEYVDRAWDLFYGREGQDALQCATPLHLRAQLSGTAYEAVRKMDHSKLRTKDENGKATDEGMKLLLKCLQDSLAQEAPVRTQELFLEYFYSPQVWRKNHESMAQYIIRRELAFAKLRESSAETQLSDNLKCMLLLIFSGLDLKEQQGILASVDNEYDYKKISHALRIQFPSAASTRPVVRRDYLGAARGGGHQHAPMRPKWKPSFQKRQHAFAAETEDDDTLVDEEAFAEEEIDENDMAGDDTYAAYSDDEALENLMGDLAPEDLEDEEVADAFATIAQHRGQQFKKRFIKRPPTSSSASPSQQSFPFKAQGDLTFDQRAKDQRRAAVSFLKSVTQCTACGMKGHWVGDPACAKSPKKGNSKGGRGKGSGKPHAKKSSSPKKSSSAFFVLSDRIESDDERQIKPNDVVAGSETLVNVKALETFAVFDPNEVPAYAKVPDTSAVFDSAEVPAYDIAAKYDMVATNAKVSEEIFDPADLYGGSSDGRNSFTFPLNVVVKTHDALMALRTPVLCEHSTYHGGDEKQFHRGANGHTRHITCKECGKNVIGGRRREAVQMWSYLVQVAMCTKFGSGARSRALAARVADLTTRALEDQRPSTLTPTRSLRRPTASPGGYDDDQWSLVRGGASPSLSSEGAKSSAQGKRMVAKIVHSNEATAFLYGVKINPYDDLPPFPDLADADMSVMQPLPQDMDVFADGPFAGRSFCEIASYAAPEYVSYTCQVMHMALNNKPMAPEIYRFAAYLYARLKLVNLASMRLLKSTDLEPAQLLGKRTQDPGQMETTRNLQIPLQHDPQDLRNIAIHYCDVMMVESTDATEPKDHPTMQELQAVEDESGLGLDDAPQLDDPGVSINYALTDSDLPGLAILDSGCTRTMHGSEWATSFEQALMGFGLVPLKKEKLQRFRGVGGETISKVVKVFPVGIGQSHGELHSAETPGSTPLLLSRPFMQQLGTIIDLSKNKVSFKALDVVDLPLIRTSRGHMAVSLLDFGDRTDLDFRRFKKDDKINDETALVSESQPAHSPEADGSPSNYSLPSDTVDSDIGHGDTYIDGYEYTLMDELDLLRPQPDWHPDDEKIHEGMVCEDDDRFWSLVSEGGFAVRSTTNKKSKKLETMNKLLDSDDLMKSRTLQGKTKPKVAHRPPVGKVWIKQIFAGQMGLTMAAVLFGMLVGCPLDSSSSPWDATDPTALARVHKDMAAEDPYLTVITHPCGPWGSWSKFNIAKGGQAEATVLSLRENSRPILSLVNKVIKDRVKAKRHVFVEQPYGSDSIEEPEMSDVRALIEDGSLYAFKVDGCQVGYYDKESNLPNYKPSYYITSMVAAESVFADCKCNCLQHQPLEGSNKYGPRTAQAAEWPKQLDHMVLECAIQQAHIEQTIVHEAMTEYEDAFPTRSASTSAGALPKRRRREGRVSTLTGQFQGPPVYLRPDAIGEDPLQHQPQPPGELDADDQDFRARQAQELDPILNQTESQRRQDWLQIDPEIRKIVRDLHVNFGHPTSVTLQRILRRQGAKPEAIRAAGLLACDSCGESIRRKRPRPVRLPNQYEFNRHLMMDTFYAKDIRGVTYGFLSIIDDATNFQVVACVGELQGPPASRAVLRHFTTSWSSWAGLPHSVQVDRGKEYMAVFADHLKQFGVEQEVMPLEAPWKGGKCEKAGDLWKTLWSKVVNESQINGIDDVMLAASIVTQTRNAFPRTSGYSPLQWVLGVPDLRLPGSLLDETESQRLEVLEAAENPTSQMARTLNIRESAKVAQVRMDTDARVRRALLRQSTFTTKHPCERSLPSWILCLLLQAATTAWHLTPVPLVWSCEGDWHRAQKSQKALR